MFIVKTTTTKKERNIGCSMCYYHLSKLRSLQGLQWPKFYHVKHIGTYFLDPYIVSLNFFMNSKGR